MIDASSLEKSRYIFLNNSNFDWSKFFSSGISNSHRLIKYSISTTSLYFIKAFSEKNLFSSDVFEEYLPSIGEIAFKLLLFINQMLKICKVNQIITFYG